jgi:hypothetical protein
MPWKRRFGAKLACKPPGPTARTQPSELMQTHLLFCRDCGNGWLPLAADDDGAPDQPAFAS